ncbi:MAG: hypothetical protein HZA91_15475 [Verrucomicrobia bacterium]|nr:hypothetical protein [Verrucomicrobiota bacterium]
MDYDDGSFDIIRLIQSDDFPLYSLTRKRPDSKLPGGAYTTAAIAALLFSTAMTTKWTAYSLRDKKIATLIYCWKGVSRALKKEAKKRTHR